ncbi:hypothetical protein GGR53DRAFT_511487 [Hypoxylon sp. FL1150]|nr:hypothetical protein GGR53DRAFT_511487 [Hypoxylon sp. FL1150]
MADIATGALAAEQIISTGLEAGVAYSIGRPTMPLLASFTQIASTSDSISSSSLNRSHHTLTVVGDKAYIFGGLTSQGKLADNNIHSIALSTASNDTPEYQVLPAISQHKDGGVPAPRSKHSACALNGCVAIYGGCDEMGDTMNEGANIWLYDVEKISWSILEPGGHQERIPLTRSDGCLLSHGGNLIIVGGKDSNNAPLSDVWHFNCFTRTWNQLPHMPNVATNAAISGDTLYVISSSDTLSSEVHHIDIKLFAEIPPSWETVPFPTNPLVPGPRPRVRCGLVPITTGLGRNYLLYFFGDRQNATENDDLPQWNDLWTFQLPSSNPDVKATTKITEAFKPAKIKDQIREKLGVGSGHYNWAEVELQPPGDLKVFGGKVHPGPRSSFGYDVTADGRSVVLWGGSDAKGESHCDGWMIRLS